MREKSLVKVVGVTVTEIGNKHFHTMGRGISPLKQGQTLSDFISRFLSERGITPSVNQRSDKLWATAPIMSSDVEPKSITTYYFLEFSLADLGYQAKDLSKEEFERDMKNLKKVIYG